MSPKKLLIVLAWLMLLPIITTAFTPASSALAGSNGQQIRFSCPDDPYGRPAMTYGAVRGRNQNGNSVRWLGPVYRGTGYTYFTTWNWWWIGDVTISWYNPRTNQWDGMRVTVPRQQSGSNITYVQCHRQIPGYP